MRDIEDYFLIGDLHTAALVSNQGSIDWLCLPDFDSPSVFAKLLDNGGGCFSIQDDSVICGYVDDTAMVETVFENEGGKYAVTDFMVPQSERESDTHILVRKLKPVENNPRVELVYSPQPDYARKKPVFQVKDDRVHLEMEEGELLLHLPEGCEVREKDNSLVISLILREEIVFGLEYIHTIASYKREEDYEGVTERFWRDWVGKGDFSDFDRDKVVRSAITLKLMQHHDTGGIVAAPTTSLPEDLGGVRNWDYRYVWIRDATFILYAFYILGYEEEAEKFFEFIESAALEGENLDLNLMYDIKGGEVPEERVLSHLSGYKDSSPVRIGNGAKDQFQLDVYGSLVDAYYFMQKRGVEISERGVSFIKKLVRNIREKWLDKDSSIWEFRDENHHYTYSKVMAWVGVHRAVQMSDRLDISKERLEEWKTLEKVIKDWVWKNCFDGVRLTQHPGTDFQDATNFLFVLLHFLHRDDERTSQIIDKTCEELVENEVFVHRYKVDDNIEGKQGAFVLCIYWMIAAFARLGRVEEAKSVFKRFESYIPDHGLMSEEIEAETGKYRGNYPQAFSHLGHIISAYYLEKYGEKFG